MPPQVMQGQPEDAPMIPGKQLAARPRSQSPQGKTPEVAPSPPCRGVKRARQVSSISIIAVRERWNKCVDILTFLSGDIADQGFPTLKAALRPDGGTQDISVQNLLQGSEIEIHRSLSQDLFGLSLEIL